MKRKYYVYVAVVTLLLTGISWFEVRTEQTEDTQVLQRGEPGEGTKQIELEVEVPQLHETHLYQLSLEERCYDEAERNALFEAAAREIEDGFAADGEDLSHITKAVHLPDSAQDGLVEVSWSFQESGVIEADGSIHSSEVSEQGTLVMVRADLAYREYEYVYEFPVCIYPAAAEGMDKILLNLEDYFGEGKQQSESATVELPAELMGYKLNWSRPNSHSWLIILGLGTLVMFLLPLYQREQEEKARQERKRQIESDYAEMLTEFALLLEAGMTARAAWEKMVNVYEKQLEKGKRKRSELYEQMRATHRYIQDGAGETGAYEQFARNCGVACCRRFSMLLIQYLQKGTKGLTETLELEAAQAFEDRKILARRRGEEAGTKLLAPMFLMLAVVIAIMLVPACMTFEL